MVRAPRTRPITREVFDLRPASCENPGPVSLLFPIALLLAVGIWYAVGGSLRPFERLPLRWWPLAPIGLALQAAPVPRLAGLAPSTVGTAMLIASYVLLLTFVAANRQAPGFFLLFIGLALNLAVIAPNAGMPVSGYALSRSGNADAVQALQAEGGAKHHLAGPGDVLRPFGDVIAVGSPFDVVVSAGDLLVYLACGWFVFGVMRGPEPVTDRRRARGYWGKHRPVTRRTARFHPAAGLRSRPVGGARSGTGR